MAVLLEGTCPPYREVLALGRQCGLVYGLLWESAYADKRLDEKRPYIRALACGGCTTWSVKGIARECHLGKDSVVESLKALLDEGFIQYAGWVFGENGTWRRWRVTHPNDLEAVRYSIEMLGSPSRKYHETANAPTELEAA